MCIEINVFYINYKCYMTSNLKMIFSDRAVFFLLPDMECCESRLGDFLELSNGLLREYAEQLMVNI